MMIMMLTYLRASGKHLEVDYSFWSWHTNTEEDEDGEDDEK